MDNLQWDAYVISHPLSTLYHLYGWKNVVEKTYGHKTYFLSAIEHHTVDDKNNGNETSKFRVCGILPLVHIKSFLFGNNLVSMPYCDMGGVLADNEEIEEALISEAMGIAKKIKADSIELRHTRPISKLNTKKTGQPQTLGFTHSANPRHQAWHTTKSDKVRMLLDLPESSEILMKSFKSKLRSQIKRPLKEGLKSKVGGLELLDHFYEVFLVNMRDLGSPVHSKQMMRQVLEQFPESAKIVIVYKGRKPIACSLIIGFKDTLENPWASALRTYSRLSPNMLLYWAMLEYACDNGFRHFDFGRSTPGEGTWRFKKQWGAEPNPLDWQYIFLKGQPEIAETSGKAKFEKAIQYWQKIPLPIARTLGPMIRKYIGL